MPGRLADGRYVLPNGWALSPAGRQVPLGGLPLKLTPIPGGPFLLASSGGYAEHFLAVIDLRTDQVVQRLPVSEAWLGLAVSADGTRVYASAGSKDLIRLYDFADGRISSAGEIPLPAGSFPAGLHAHRTGDRLYAVANLGNALLVIDPKARRVTARVPVGTKPYTCAVADDESTAYVSNWGEDSVAVIDLAAARVARTIKVQDHPNDLLLAPDRGTLFVANGNRNTVSVIDTARSEVIEQIDVALRPGSPPGSTPNALALDASRGRLFVANADNNAVAVIDVSEKGRSRPRGFIPTGWYPTAVCLSGDGKRLAVANGKGSVSRPAALLGGAPPVPGTDDLPGKSFDYVGRLLEGTLSIIDPPDDRTLAEYSRQAQRNSPLGRDGAVVEAPFRLGKESPIQHVIYIIKENRTYDCIFGDMKEGNGDPDYCLLPEEVTPNHHALARQFVLFDNFYHDAEVSADGHHWVTSAYATDYVEKFWPAFYAHRTRRTQDFHDDPVAFSRGGFLWDLCARAGLSYRSYGEFARIRGAEPGKVRAATPSLEGHIHPTYYGADGIRAMSDSTRLELWMTDFRADEARGTLPRLTVMSLPGDHLVGTRPGLQTPRAMMAENDLVLGKIVEAVSRSRYWPKTAIFVVEDDAQNGPDHVDCHRTVALVLSPYVRRHLVDSTPYSTSSMLRTIELILGLPPLTQYDAAATPMWAAFRAEPGLNPYEALPARVPIDEKNTSSSFGARRSQELALDEADSAPDEEYNQLLWKAIKGRDSVMPPRRVSAIVLGRDDRRDDDD